MRILVVTYGILELHLYVENELRQLIALAARGHEVTYVSGRSTRVMRSAEDTPRFTLECLFLGREVKVLSLILFELMALFRTLRYIGHYDAVVLDVNSVPLLFPLLFVHRLLRGHPLLCLRVQSNPVETGGYLRTFGITFLYALSTKLAAVFFDRIFFISPMMSDLYSHQIAIPKHKTSIWPSSVDIHVFDPSSRERQAHRLQKELGLSTEIVVLYHGSLSKGRGILETIEAFRILREEDVKARLMVLGFGMTNDFLRHLKTEDNVVLCGPVPYVEVPNYIAACTVGIVPLPDHPWWRYQCPLKVLECLAMNKPLILSNIPAHRWIVGDAPVAQYLKGTDPRSIADGVRAFCRNAKHLEPSLGRELASGFSTEEVAKMLERIFLSVFSRSSAR
jgi:glycosyltransferase involved in cell wall biosynthesis